MDDGVEMARPAGHRRPVTARAPRTGLIAFTGRYGIGLAVPRADREDFVLNATTAGLYATGTLTGTTVQAAGRLPADGAAYRSRNPGRRSSAHRRRTPRIRRRTESPAARSRACSSVERRPSTNPLLSNSISATAWRARRCSAAATAARSPRCFDGSDQRRSDHDQWHDERHERRCISRAVLQQPGRRRRHRLHAGRALLGYEDVTIGPSGSAVIAKAFAKGIQANDWISTTATKLSAGTTPTNTSAFSTGVRATSAAAGGLGQRQAAASAAGISEARQRWRAWPRAGGRARIERGPVVEQARRCSRSSACWTRWRPPKGGEIFW